LTPHEKEVLELTAKGYRSKEIADALGLSPQTVETHFRNICEKLHVRSPAEAVVRFLIVESSSSANFGATSA